MGGIFGIGGSAPSNPAASPQVAAAAALAPVVPVSARPSANAMAISEQRYVNRRRRSTQDVLGGTGGSTQLGRHSYSSLTTLGAV